MTSSTNKHSESVNVKEASVLITIGNTPECKELNQDEDSADDSDEEPPFLFEYRGKNIPQVAGLSDDTAKKRTPQQDDNDSGNLEDEKVDELDERAKADAARKAAAVKNDKKVKKGKQ